MSPKKPRSKKSSKAAQEAALVRYREQSTAPVLKGSEDLGAYLSAIGNYPLLSPEDEKKVAEKYHNTKDPEAARILVVANLRLVVKIANDYLQRGIQLLDLIQEGNVGLLQAVKDYDPYRGVKFSTYASYWIKAYIRQFILRNWSLVKIGTTKAQRALFYRLQKEKSRLEALGIEPEAKLLAERFEVKEREINEMTQRMGSRDLSLNTPIRSGQTDDLSLIHSLPDDQPEIDFSLAEREIESEFSRRLDHFETTLAGKELVVFRERLRSEEPKTLQEIGEQYGITRERVRQIEARVIEKLKSYMKKHAKFGDDIIDV
ncbi:MAG: sigma-70 family RNA polymerase sigma factor [Bradymonadales bacterium]|nr:MAG: sigma-70 family RNA polymerase sigma factor [Bradymonadales bacterium]